MKKWEGKKIRAQSARKIFAAAPTIQVYTPFIGGGAMAQAPNEEVEGTMHFGPPTLTAVDRNSTIFRLH